MSDGDARSRIREAALERFGRHGVRDTSTREILTAAGLKNPSAISYHFGSKGELVEDLVGELIRGTAPVLQLQIELAKRSSAAALEEWTAIAVDSAVNLVATERGCLLACLWAEYDGSMQPRALETFLVSGNPVASAWQTAVASTFPLLPQHLAVSRNVIMFRTLEWMIARRAGRILSVNPSPTLKMDDTTKFRQLIFEVALAIVSAPSELGDDDITLG
jgi:AcrR family transcriptional regulator